MLCNQIITSNKVDKVCGFSYHKPIHLCTYTFYVCSWKLTELQYLSKGYRVCMYSTEDTPAFSFITGQWAPFKHLATFVWMSSTEQEKCFHWQPSSQVSFYLSRSYWGKQAPVTRPAAVVFLQTVPTSRQDLASCYLQGLGGARNYKARQCWAFVRKCNSASFGQTRIVLLLMMACIPPWPLHRYESSGFIEKGASFSNGIPTLCRFQSGTVPCVLN